jgi:hypothetical protein
LAITQLSVAVSLISGLSLSGLALGFSLLQNEQFTPTGKIKAVFVWSFPLLLLVAQLRCGYLQDARFSIDGSESQARSRSALLTSIDAVPPWTHTGALHGFSFGLALSRLSLA